MDKTVGVRQSLVIIEHSFDGRFDNAPLLEDLCVDSLRAGVLLDMGE